MDRSPLNKELTNSAEYPETSSKVAYGITAFGGSVHESITKEAVRLADMAYGNLVDGVVWNDAPSDNPEKENYLGVAHLHKSGTVTYESHNGSKQFWHSMTPSDKPYTNGEVKDKIIEQAAEWYKQARQTDNTYHLGKVLHMVQDSYVLSHVERDVAGKVRNFQSYNEQDAHQHGVDEMRQLKTVTEIAGIKRQVPEDWQEVPGTLNALKASTDILKLYKSGASSEELKAYLREKVYPFENEQTQFKPAGGTDPKYAPKINHQIADSAPESDDKHALMVKAYLEEPTVEAIQSHPDLVHVYVRKAAVAAEIVDMHPKGQAFVLANFDTIAVNDISQGKITPMHINSRDTAQEIQPPQHSRTEFS